MKEDYSANFIGIKRHRITTDGEGVTTLVAFYGCPLRCQYCLNPQCNEPSSKILKRTVTELFEETSIDNLYFQATGGGITFGGGEPLLNSDFIKQFHDICPENWNINIETSLNVELSHIEKTINFVHQYIIDIKDLNPRIYLNYTGKDNVQVLSNLKWISEQGLQGKCKIRIPLIPSFNTETDQDNSIALLKEFGFSHFDKFKYDTERPLKKKAGNS